MFSFLRNIILIVLLCVVISGFSQNTPYGKSETGIAEFKYIDDPGNFDHYTNHFIRKLAEGNKLSVRDISYKFYYTVTTRLVLENADKRSGRISFEGMIILGNIKYRGFSKDKKVIRGAIFPEARFRI